MTPQSPAPQPGRLAVHLPADVQPTYVNFVVITHSASEVVLDLAQVMPQVAEARVRARVVMTPLNAKLLLRALAENLGRFESQFGPIVVPEGSSLADQLFRPPTADGGGDE